MTLQARARRRHTSRQELLASELADARTRPLDVISVIALPAPAAAPEVLWDALPDQPAALWDPPGDDAHAGVGVAVEIVAEGRDRFASIRDQLTTLWSRVHATAARAPRVLGGFAFAPGAASRAPWRGFGDASWTLPRWSYRREGERAWLELAVDSRAADNARRWMSELDRIEAALLGHGPRRSVPASGSAQLEELDPAIWREHVETIRRAIFARRCQKVVAARCSHAMLDQAPAAEAVLARLGERYPNCYRFGFRRDGDTFLGATPERLVAKHGAQVTTEALAGSIATDSGDAAALLSSTKDRDEQHLVVDAITAALAPWCEQLDVPATPRIRALRHVLHLETPIRGQLARPTHVLDLAATLHPTPAVGGVPTRAALSWIEEYESTPRGWYASPVGWIDGDGDGDVAVALRSALLSGRAAYVYAGAGIVRESDPDAEYAETRVKQRAIFDALGVDG